MTDITKVQIIEKAIEFINDDSIYYMCNALLSAVLYFNLNEGEHHPVYIELVQELNKHKPKVCVSTVIWFNPDEKGKQKRLKILNKLLNNHSNNDRHKD